MYRFATSLKDDMHIQNLRIAIFTYLIAKQGNQEFVLCIEDCNNTNDVKDKENLQILQEFGLIYDKIYYQNINLKFYRQFASTLLQEKKAFLCFCSQNLLKEKQQRAKKAKKIYKYDESCKNLSDYEVLNNQNKSTIRLKKPSQNIMICDKIKGSLSFKASEIDDFIILNEDKYPTLNFANSIDDMLMDINFIISEDGKMLNTKKQELIRKYLGYNKKINYVHLPNLNVSNEKEQNFSVKNLLKEGFLASAILNYLILLTSKMPCEIFSLKDALLSFKIENIQQVSEKFSLQKLKYINIEHIRMLDDETIDNKMGFKNCAKIVKLMKEVYTINEIKENLNILFSKQEPIVKLKPNILLLKEIIYGLEEIEKFENFIKILANKSKLKDKEIAILLEFLLTKNLKCLKPQDLYPFIYKKLKEFI